MRLLRLTNRVSGSVLGDRVAVADSWWARLRGLLGRRSLESGHGLLLEPCDGIHMFGMAFPIDALFLDGDWRVVAVYPDLQPGGRTRRHRDARRVLELPTGVVRASGTREGDTIVWQEISA